MRLRFVKKLARLGYVTKPIVGNATSLCVKAGTPSLRHKADCRVDRQGHGTVGEGPEQEEGGDEEVDGDEHRIAGGQRCRWGQEGVVHWWDGSYKW